MPPYEKSKLSITKRKLFKTALLKCVLELHLRMKQLSLIPKPQLACGGSLNNTRHSKRTLCSRRPIHLVLKTKNSTSLFKSRLVIKSLASKYAKQFGIKVYASSVQRDHIHFVIKIAGRISYIRFIRSLTGQLARRFGKGLFKFRPFTRLGTWGREFKDLLDYLFRNDMEVFKIWRYQRNRADPK